MSGKIKNKALIGLLALFPFCSNAELGGKLDSVRSDQAKMKASLRVDAKPTFTVHALESQTGNKINEYVNIDDVVFAVSWNGPTMPNLQQLLGSTYFDRYTTELAASKHAARGPILIQQSDFVIHSGGRLRAFSGKAYVPSLLPAGFDLDEIQ